MSATERLEILLLDAGADWVLYLLGALLFVALVIFVERLLEYRAARVDVHALAKRIDALLSSDARDQAIEELSRSRSVAASVAKAGLRLAYRGIEASKSAMQSAAALERSRLQRHLSYLGTIGSNAPFVGLFGTVVGIIHAFDELGQVDPTQAASQLASQSVMLAVGEALVATAVGILVAIPSIAAYNFLQRRVSAIIAQTEVLANLVLAYLSPTAEPGTAPAPEPKEETAP
ncbi:MAG: MotA/TolQ/ExbB proton channel family protein [Myxococcota bacterium]|jgi:biopolymer transport protein ExbB|nr:MotA/TolQ/ExbB proton channel family protein [Myxococcota bacterium]